MSKTRYLHYLARYERALFFDMYHGNAAAAKRAEAIHGRNRSQLIAMVVSERKVAREKLNILTLTEKISRTIGIQSTVNK